MLTVRQRDNFKGEKQVVNCRLAVQLRRVFLQNERMTCPVAAHTVTCYLIAILIALSRGFAPIHAADPPILINEIFTGSPDWVELYNAGDEPVALDGWHIRSWSLGANDYQYENHILDIPAGTLLNPGEFLVVSEDPVGNCSIPASSTLLWCAMESLCVSIESAGGAPVDLAVVGGVFGDPDIETIQGTIYPPFSTRDDADVIRRVSLIDTDSGSDWVCGGDPSPCSLNPDQTVPQWHSDQSSISTTSPVQAVCRDASPPQTKEEFTSENVIIVVIDGLRYQDAFNTDTLYRMPNINGRLRPMGAFLDNFYNHGMTITTPGHAAMLSGVYMPVRNNRSDRKNIRMQFPSMFEYYIKKLSDEGMSIENARDHTCQIYGKRIECGTMYASLHPQFGDSYRSNMEFPDPENAIHQDMRVYNSLMDIMTADHPRMTLINLAQTDEQGHLGTWDAYVYSFRKADEIIDAIWRRIQTDNNYRDKTTLLVLTDHGRNDDDHGGFHHHGCPCKGCRHSFLLSIGPDTPPGTESDVEHSLIDICPTVAAMFGFDPVFSEGRFMPEIFYPGLSPRDQEIDPVSLSASAEGSFHPVIASDEFRTCMGWVENSDPPTIVRVTSGDNGATWSNKQVMVWPRNDQTIRWFDMVLSDDDVLYGLITASENPSSKETPAEWLIYLMNLDTGAELTVQNVGKMATLSRMQTGNGLLRYPWSYYISKGDAPNFAEDEIRLTDVNPLNGVSQTATVSTDQLKCCFPDLAMIGDSRHIAYNHFFDDRWSLSYSRSMDHGTTWMTRDLLNPTTGRILLPPQIGQSGTDLIVVYAQMGDFGSEWNLMMMHSSDTGLTWSGPAALSSPGSSAWNPVVLVRNGVIFVVWSSFSTNGVDLCGRWSLDGGTNWSSEEILVPGLTSVADLDADIAGQDALIAWSDPSDGQLECYFKRIENIFSNDGMNSVGVHLWLPDEKLDAGDPCACWITLQNPSSNRMDDVPLVVLIEAGGQFFFWPSYGSFDYETVTLPSGLETFEILDEFEWPEIGAAGSANWFATLMTPGFKDFLGFYSFVPFRWS